MGHRADLSATGSGRACLAGLSSGFGNRLTLRHANRYQNLIGILETGRQIQGIPVCVVGKTSRRVDCALKPGACRQTVDTGSPDRASDMDNNRLRRGGGLIGRGLDCDCGGRFVGWHSIGRGR